MKIPASFTGIGRHNTKVYRYNGNYTVWLYSTMIYEENHYRITLNNGGFVTATTARRINQVLTHRGFSHSVRISRGVMYYGNEPFDGYVYVIQKGVSHE